MVQQKNIVIVGGGVAGMEIATRLGHRLGKTHKAQMLPVLNWLPN